MMHTTCMQKITTKQVRHKIGKILIRLNRAISLFIYWALTDIQQLIPERNSKEK